MTPTATGTKPRRFQTAGLPSVHLYQGPSSEIAHGSTPWATRKRNGANTKARRRGTPALRAGLAPEGSGVLIGVPPWPNDVVHLRGPPRRTLYRANPKGRPRSSATAG